MVDAPPTASSNLVVGVEEEERYLRPITEPQIWRDRDNAGHATKQGF